MFSRGLRKNGCKGMGMRKGMVGGRRNFSMSVKREADFTHAVIGGGAVGLAIARRLAGREGGSTVLIERNEAVGMETSSRNSEVIHAGLYYAAGSLKTELCVEGRHMMYDLCQKQHIPHNNCGKWIVAQTNEQWEELVKVHKFSNSIGVPTHFLSIPEAAKLEPFVKADVGILVSPTTGIVDSHALMQYLLGSFEDCGGDVALNSTVVGIQGLTTSNSAPGSAGWEVRTKDRSTGDETVFTAEVLINSAGLGAIDVNNMVMPEHCHRKAYYAKGNYFSYAPSTPRARHLIYPAPEPGLGGLGTHLTLDISGRIRFGPDVEWVDDLSNLAVNTSRLAEAIVQIKKFFPEIQEEAIVPDYAGIRPKLRGKSATVDSKLSFDDFYIEREEDGVSGFVNLMGIESPGLTSCLAIGEMVHGLLYR